MWITTTLAGLAEYIDAADLDERDITSVDITMHDGQGHIALTPDAWARLAVGRTPQWDADAARGRATGTFTVGRIEVTARWTRDELETVAPDVAAQLFPPRRSATLAWSGGEQGAA